MTRGLDALISSLLADDKPAPPRDTAHWVGPAHLRPPLHPVTKQCPRGCWWCLDYDRDLFDLLQVEHDLSGRRFCNPLLRHGVRKVADLRAFRPYRLRGRIVDSLFDVPGLGPEGVTYVRGRLREHG